MSFACFILYMENNHRRLIARCLRILSIFLLIFNTLPLTTAQAAVVLYVSPTGPAAGNCDSWANACSLPYALQKATPGSQIWVMAGVYVPGTNRSDTFRLKNGVAVYGGFAGNEILLEKRSWLKNKTILSGDLLKNDSADPNSTSDNSYHVVMAEGVDFTAVLDGFTILSGNANGQGNDRQGAGVHILNASPMLNNLALSFHTAQNGAGISCSGDSSPNLTNMLITQNRAAASGGGFYSELGCVAFLYGSLFSANQADFGGAMNNYYATSILINATISGNTARTAGGGILNSDGTMVVANSILWNNHQNQALNQISESGTTYSFVYTNIIQGGFAPPDENVENWDVNPLFVRDASSGADGLWGTLDDAPGELQLRSQSPAVDKGDSGLIPTSMTRDLRDWPRILPHPGPETPEGPIVDLGGYEAGVLYVKRNAAGLGNGSSWLDAFTQLSSALAFAHAGDEIWVATATYLPGATRASTFQLKSEVALYGGFAGVETLRAQRSWLSYPVILSGDVGQTGVSTDNVYHVVTANGAGATTILDGFTIRAGQADGPASSDKNGGGIFITNGAALQLANLILTGNQAVLGAGAYSRGSRPAFQNVIFSKNQAQSGGGLYMENDSAALQQVAFQDNSAVTGGGLFGTGSNYTLTGGTFLRNKATDGAGAAHTGNSTPRLYNMFFLGNVATGNGGGIQNTNSASPDLSNAVFSGNQAGAAGGIFINNSRPVLRNVTLVGNEGGALHAVSTPAGGPTLVSVIAWNNTARPFVVTSSSPLILNSLLEGGCPAQAICQSVVSQPPQMVRLPSPGADQTWGTLDDDYGNVRLKPGSPAIDAGNNLYVLPAVTTDIAGQPRFYDEPGTPDTGVGQPPIVDMGPYETHFAPSETEINPIVPQTVTAGQQISISFRVIGNTITPTGTVQVSDGDLSCSSALTPGPSTGTAVGSCSLTFNTGGLKQLVAVYLGDQIYDPSSSNAYPYQVDRIATNLSLSLEPSSSTSVGQMVHAKYSLTPQVALANREPGGIVVVSFGTGSCSGSLSAGVCDLVFPALGSYNVTARYDGDLVYAPTTSSPVAHQVSKIATRSSIISRQPSGATIPGQPVWVSFSVQPVTTGTTAPTGSIVISDGVDSCTANISAGGCSLILNSVGFRKLVAHYLGDENYNESWSEAVTHLVQAGIYLPAISR